MGVIIIAKMKDDKKTKNKGKGRKVKKAVTEEPEDVVTLEVIVPETYDPAKERAQLLKPMHSMRTYLRRLLNEDGSYKKKYSQQLKLTAQSVMLLEDCYMEIMRRKGASRYTSIETSREGNPRQDTAALIKTYIRLDQMCRRNLAALGMNMERYARTPGPGDGNDSLDAFMQELNQ